MCVGLRDAVDLPHPFPSYFCIYREKDICAKLTVLLVEDTCGEEIFTPDVIPDQIAIGKINSPFIKTN